MALLCFLCFCFGFAGIMVTVIDAEEIWTWSISSAWAKSALKNREYLWQETVCGARLLTEVGRDKRVLCAYLYNPNPSLE